MSLSSAPSTTGVVSCEVEFQNTCARRASGNLRHYDPLADYFDRVPHALLTVSLTLAVTAGTFGTLCAEAGFCNHAILCLPLFVAGIGGLIACTRRNRSPRDTIGPNPG